LQAVSRYEETMEPNLNQERQQAHALLDMLPAAKLNAVRGLLEVMVEPLARDGRGAGPRPCFAGARRGHSARRDPARVRTEPVSEDPAPERIAVIWSPEAGSKSSGSSSRWSKASSSAIP
jgi:hypothetical protein